MKSFAALVRTSVSLRPSAHAAVIAAVLAAAFALVALPAHAAGAAPTAPKADPAKGQAVASGVCVACHAIDGSRGLPQYPILAGQHPEYLSKQLHEFKAGKRVNAIMQGFAATLSDEDMANVAAFYASKQPQPGVARDKTLVELGERIYRGGIADKLVPACAGCHSPSGIGIPAQYPRLGGQHAEYTETQMNAFRAGTRANSIQMTGIAAKLSDREIKAVSDYIAGLR